MAGEDEAYLSIHGSSIGAVPNAEGIDGEEHSAIVWRKLVLASCRANAMRSIPCSTHKHRHLKHTIPSAYENFQVQQSLLMGSKRLLKRPA